MRSWGHKRSSGGMLCPGLIGRVSKHLDLRQAWHVRTVLARRHRPSSFLTTGNNCKQLKSLHFVSSPARNAPPLPAAPAAPGSGSRPRKSPGQCDTPVQGGRQRASVCSERKGWRTAYCRGLRLRTSDSKHPGQHRIGCHEGKAPHGAPRTCLPGEVRRARVIQLMLQPLMLFRLLLLLLLLLLLCSAQGDGVGLGVRVLRRRLLRCCWVGAGWAYQGCSVACAAVTARQSASPRGPAAAHADCRRPARAHPG